MMEQRQDKVFRILGNTYVEINMLLTLPKICISLNTGKRERYWSCFIALVLHWVSGPYSLFPHSGIVSLAIPPSFSFSSKEALPRDFEQGLKVTKAMN